MGRLGLLVGVLRERVRRHRVWYRLWLAVNAAVAAVLAALGADADTARRALALTNMVMVFVDEYHVMGHRTRLRDLLGYYDKRLGLWVPSHELVAFILFLAAIA